MNDRIGIDDENTSIPNINKKDPEGVRPDGTPYNILIADDSLFVVKLLKQFLTSEGYNIVGAAGDGEEAVELFQANINKVDLVTLDITMPKMDGIGALKKILSIKPDAAIIMISAIGREDLVKEALTIGAKNYVVKPLNREKVLSRIKQTLERVND